MGVEVEFGVRFKASSKTVALPSRERAEAYVRVWSWSGFPAELVTRSWPGSPWALVCSCGPGSTHDEVHACEAAPCDGRELMRASLRAEYATSAAARGRRREPSVVGGGSR